MTSILEVIGNMAKRASKKTSKQFIPSLVKENQDYDLAGNFALKSTKSSESPEIILETSLQSFFFDQLHELNRKSSRPLSQETIYYSSTVLDKFSESNNYFETVEGRIREKILGLKLLESQSESKLKQKKILSDIGDTALFMCGYFSQSLNTKIVDSKYYSNLGISAYQRLNHLEPDFMEVPSFYLKLSGSFSAITDLISAVAHKLNKENSDITFMTLNISTIKVS